MNSNEARIGDLCRLIKGVYPTLKTEPGEYPLVVTAAYRRTASTFQIEGPAVCVPLVSSTGHGNAALHRVHYQEGKFAVANLLVALVPKNPEVTFSKYLYYLLQAKKDSYFVPLMKGTANVSLSVEKIGNVKIPLPSIGDQRRIATKLEAIAQRAEQSQAIQIVVESDLQSVLLGTFARLTANAPRMIMSEVAPLVRRRVTVDLETEYAELGVRSFGKGTFHKPSLTGAELGEKKISRIATGDLIFQIIFAWEGAVAVARSEDHGRVGSHRFLTCVPKPGIATANFLRFHFLTPEGLKQLGDASPGGAGRNRTLGLNAFANIPVPIPPIEKQYWFDKLCEKITAIRIAHASRASDLDALMPSVLNKIFKGKL